VFVIGVDFAGLVLDGDGTELQGFVDFGPIFFHLFLQSETINFIQARRIQVILKLEPPQSG
jgi:hypothetical protein